MLQLFLDHSVFNLLGELQRAPQPDCFAVCAGRISEETQENLFHNVSGKRLARLCFCASCLDELLQVQAQSGQS